MVKFYPPFPSKYQHSLYKYAPIVYGAKIKYAAGPDNTLSLDAAGILPVQSIVGELLYYARAVDNKLLVALSELGQQQVTAIEATNDTTTSSWTTSPHTQLMESPFVIATWCYQPTPTQTI